MRRRATGIFSNVDAPDSSPLGTRQHESSESVITADEGTEDQRVHFDTAPEIQISEDIVQSSTGKQGREGAAGAVDHASDAGSQPREVGKLSPEAYRLWGMGTSDSGSDTKYCKGGPNLLVCGNPVESSDAGVHCDKCNQWFHSSCQAVPIGAYRALKRFAILSWLCAECKLTLVNDNSGKSEVISKQNETLSQQSEKLSELDSKVDGLSSTFREYMHLIQGSLKEQEAATMHQIKLVERSFKEQAELKDACASMIQGSCNEVVKVVEHSIKKQTEIKDSYASIVQGTCDKVVKSVNKLQVTPPAAPPLNIGSQAAKEIAGMFDSFTDKERRKCNVVVHNLPEDPSQEHVERTKRDIQKFSEILRHELKLNVKVTRAFRAGKVQPGKHRLLIVSLDSVEAKIELLKLARQLRTSDNWSNLYISPDLPFKEREVNRKLREELKARKNAGETNLYIWKGKIVKGQDKAGSGSQAGQQQEMRPNSGSSANQPEPNSDHPAEHLAPGQQTVRQDVHPPLAAEHPAPAQQAEQVEVHPAAAPRADAQEVVTHASGIGNGNEPPSRRN